MQASEASPQQIESGGIFWVDTGGKIVFQGKDFKTITCFIHH
jgi:hypothetical protein